MPATAKTYLVHDAGKNARSKIPPAVFPGTLAGLPDALDAARYLSRSKIGSAP